MHEIIHAQNRYNFTIQLITMMYKRILLLLVICFLLSGCYLFRPKNKCADCPNWGKSKKHASLLICNSDFWC